MKSNNSSEFNTPVKNSITNDPHVDFEAEMNRCLGMRKIDNFKIKKITKN